MAARHVIIVAPSDDIHALAVRKRILDLYDGSIACHIFDVATYPLHSRIEACFEVNNGRVALHIAPPFAESIGPQAGKLLLSPSIREQATTVILDEDTAVWWRRARRPVVHPDVTEPEFGEFCALVLNATLLSALNLCHVRNAFDAESMADRKIHQMHAAVSVGLNVPRTLVSQDVRAVEEFASQLKSAGKVVLHKHAASTRLFGKPVRLFDNAARARLAHSSYAPSIFQEEIAGGDDLRIAVIGNTIFCCAWRGASQPRILRDIRLDEDARMHRMPLPSGLSELLLRLHSALKLDIGIYDFKLNGDGTPFFLEVNPSGQWLDMEINGEQPITDAIAHLLVEGGTSAQPRYSSHRLRDEDLTLMMPDAVDTMSLHWTQSFGRS